MEEKNRGVTRACSKCGHGIASRIRFMGLWWELDIYCRNPECKSRETIKLGQKAIVTIGTALLIFVFTFATYTRIEASKMTCKSFKTPDRTWRQAHDAAQNYYNHKLPGYEKLDGWDKDGVVCEN